MCLRLGVLAIAISVAGCSLTPRSYPYSATRSAGSSPQAESDDSASTAPQASSDPSHPPSEDPPSYGAGRWDFAGISGWVPNISPDAKYVSCGFAQTVFVNLETRQTQLIDSAGSNGHWIRPGVFTYFRPTSNTTALRFEVKVSDLIPRETSDDPSLVIGNEFVAAIPNFEMNIHDGFVAYGGRGAVRGITPSGQDVDLTITPFRLEGNPRLFYVGGELWLGTSAWDEARQRGYALLRPWGEKTAIVIDGAGLGLSVVHKGGLIVVAFHDTRGLLTVVSVPADSPRRAL